jgi:hypothetical protein
VAIVSLVWDEDIDLSGGAAAIAAATAGQQNAVTISTDDLLPQWPSYLVGVATADESPVVATDPGILTVLGHNRTYSLPLSSYTGVNPIKWLPGNGNYVQNGETLRASGNGGGSGAEQHCVVAYLDNPALPPWDVSSPPADAEIIRVEQTTAARVANQISGYTDICGRTTAFAGSQTKIASDPDTHVWIMSVEPSEPAGYSGTAIRSPSGDKMVFLPAPALGNPIYTPGTWLGGGLGLHCTAAAPYEVGGCGVGTTAGRPVLTLAVQWARK